MSTWFALQYSFPVHLWKWYSFFQMSCTLLNVVIVLLDTCCIKWIFTHCKTYCKYYGKQSTVYTIFCCCTGMAWIINSCLRLNEYGLIWESQLAVFSAKVGYQKYNVLVQMILHRLYLRHKSSAQNLRAIFEYNHIHVTQYQIADIYLQMNQ